MQAPREKTDLDLQMEKKGYVRLSVATVQLKKNDASFLRKLIERERVLGERVGSYWYVSLESLALYLGPTASKAYALPYPDKQPPSRKVAAVE